MSATSVANPAMTTTTTPPLEPFGSPKSSTSDESSVGSSIGESPSRADGGDGADSISSASSTISSEDAAATQPITTAAHPAIDAPNGCCCNGSVAAASANPLKRKRAACHPSSAVLTPPLSASDDDDDEEDERPPTTSATLARALHVLGTEAAALAHTTALYTASPAARRALLAAVRIVAAAHARGGKVVVCGVGKSGLVGRKLVATLKSLGVGAAFLHAAEAVHGDLGDVRRGDAVLFISFSGKTAELLNVLPHVGSEVPVIALTGFAAAAGDGAATGQAAGACPLLAGRRVVGGGGEDAEVEEEFWGDEMEGVGVLLPAPIHESEEKSFGVSAPTTSTTVAMAVGDMLAITAAERIYGADKGRVFKRNHPGGAIGAKTAAEGVVAAAVAVAANKKVCLEKRNEQ